MTVILNVAERFEKAQSSDEAIVVNGLSKRYGQVQALGGSSDPGAAP